MEQEQDTGESRPAGDAEPYQPTGEPYQPTGEPYQPTGEPRVDAALRNLDKLAGLPVSEHPAVFERVHASLREVLGELDPDSGGTRPRRDR